MHAGPEETLPEQMIHVDTEACLDRNTIALSTRTDATHLPRSRFTEIISQFCSPRSGGHGVLWETIRAGTRQPQRLASSLLEMFWQGLPADAFQPAAVGVRD